MIRLFSGYRLQATGYRRRLASGQRGRQPAACRLQADALTQITSGASEIIFMNFRSRSSRATGPNTRVPIGSP